LAARLQASREEEKTQLARELHDELNGTLIALKMDLSLLPDRVTKDHKLFLEKLISMSELIDRTLARVHTIVTELRPVVLDQMGLVAAIEWQTGEFQDRSGMVCETHLPTEEITLDPERSTAVFRILQEALTNVARHANATKVVVDLRSEAGILILTVRDNGKGIDEKMIFAHHSMGLLGMRERALSFGGKTEVGRLPGRGTLVSMRIPIK
jgi:signal transduction histidine kinase